MGGWGALWLCMGKRWVGGWVGGWGYLVEEDVCGLDVSVENGAGSTVAVLVEVGGWVGGWVGGGD